MKEAFKLNKNKKKNIKSISWEKARVIYTLEVVDRMVKDLPFDKLQKSRYDSKFEKKLVDHRECLLELVDKINNYGFHKQDQRR